VLAGLPKGRLMRKEDDRVDWDKVAKMTLALMHLTSFKEHGVVRSWKGYDWDALSLLHQRGWISDPVSKAKSVALSEEGERRSRQIFEQHFGKAV
jgi:hypothetical protein